MPPLPSPAPSTPALRRQLGLFDALAIVVGIMIGAGIFLVPNLVAGALPAPGWMLAAWLLTGIVSWFGALAFAEMGAMLPATGGQYVYLREAWGRAPAFLCGWTHFLVSQSGSIAFLSVSFAIYVSFFVPLSRWESKAVALAVMGLLTWVNYRGVRPGAALQDVSTLAKLAGIALIAAGAWLAAHHRHAPPPAMPAWFGPLPLGAFGVAMIACFQAYDGWSAVSFVAGEVRRPEKTLFRALSLGVLLVVAVYLLVNLSYLRVLSVPEIAASARVGALAAERGWGSGGAALAAAIILVSILGSLNGRMLTQPRVYYAQACDGLFFRPFAGIHPRHHTPGFSILAQFAWSAVLVVSGSFESIIDYRVFGILALNAATVAGVIALRRRRPAQPRPYRMWGYPVTPLVFVAVAVAFMANMLIQRPAASLIGLAIMAAGLPVYYLEERRNRPAAD